MTGYFKAMRRFSNFGGRASRAEFWGFFLVYAIIYIVATIIDTEFKTRRIDNEIGLTVAIVAAIHVLPSIATLIRRLHDGDYSGWWFWIGITGVGLIVLFVFACMRGTAGPNRFGAEPTETAQGRPAGFAGPAMGHSTQAAAPARDAIAEIERLAELRAKGSLSDAEFEVMKAKALSGRA